MMSMPALLVPAFAQKAEEPYGPYISATFARHRMELPKLAWLVPPRTIVAPGKAAALWIWSEAGSLSRADYRGRLTPAELRDFRRTEGIACARAAEHDRYELPDPVEPNDANPTEDARGKAVLFTTKSEAQIIHGATITDTSEEELTRARQLFGLAATATRSKGFNVLAGDYVFTFAGFYDDESGEMYASGLILTRRAGNQTIASYSWDVSPDTVCEGCEVPQYDEPLEDNFGLLNIVHVPHFPYPLLLEDSGTEDEDALSLVTFSAQAAYAEYRVYESTEGCDELVTAPPMIAAIPRTDGPSAIGSRAPRNGPAGRARARAYPVSRARRSPVSE
jgi:hypothetical protein